MKNVSIANRYARAATQLAEEQKALPTVLEQAQALRTALEDADLRTAIANPRLTARQRAALVNALAGGLHPVLYNTLGVMAHNGRLGELTMMLDDMQALADTAAGVTRVKVETAATLSPAQRKMLEQQVKDATKAAQIILEETSVPGLKGGFRAFFAGKVWDASLAGSLRRLRNHLSVNVKTF